MTQRMRWGRSSWLLVAVAVLLPLASAQEIKLSTKKKKEQEPVTQVLELPKDPPATITVDTARLSFEVAPLSTKRLLSQQVRDAVKALQKQHRGAQIARLRAFVAGNGDLRRVPAIVGEEFADDRLPLPVLTVVQVGALPDREAQVLLESVAVERRPANPHGIAFLSGQLVTGKEVLEPVGPLLSQSLRQLEKAAEAAGSRKDDVLRVTCFVSSLDELDVTDAPIRALFPNAAVSLLQLQRAPIQALAECEGVSRLSAAPAQTIERLNPAGLTTSPNYSQVVKVNTPKLIWSGAQLGFRAQEEDVRLAFQRLAKALDAGGTATEQVVLTGVYSLSPGVTQRIRKVRSEFLNAKHPPASTLLPFEGLPGLDASFAIDVVAVPR